MPKDPEKHRAAVKKWKQANPEKVRAINSRWDKANPRREAKERWAKWAEANPEKARGRKTKYRKANPGLTALNHRRDHAREHKAKLIFDQLAKINPNMYEAIADSKLKKGRAMLNALKSMGIEILA